jgi:hypothetical protein
MRIAIDAMGGDNAPDEIIAGVLESVKLLDKDDELILVGSEEIIEAQLQPSLVARGTGHGRRATNRVHFLVRVGRFGKIIKLAADFFFESTFEIMSNDKNEFAKSGIYGVIDRIIDNYFAVGTNGVNLLKSTVASSQTRRQNQ